MGFENEGGHPFSSISLYWLPLSMLIESEAQHWNYLSPHFIESCGCTSLTEMLKYFCTFIDGVKDILRVEFIKHGWSSVLECDGKLNLAIVIKINHLGMIACTNQVLGWL